MRPRDVAPINLVEGKVMLNERVPLDLLKTVTPYTEVNAKDGTR